MPIAAAATVAVGFWAATWAKTPAQDRGAAPAAGADEAAGVRKAAGDTYMVLVRLQEPQDGKK